MIGDLGERVHSVHVACDQHCAEAILLPMNTRVMLSSKGSGGVDTPAPNLLDATPTACVRRPEYYVVQY